MITVEKLTERTFRVTVAATSSTTHEVTVAPDYAARLAGDNASAERLVEASFEFLLERESNTAILRRFDLPVIGHYYPEYEGQIAKRL